MPEMTEVEKPAVADTKPDHSSSSTQSDTDDEIPELEDAGNGTAGTASFPGAAAAAATGLPMEMVSKAKQSRGEKKARKIMSKLGLKMVSPFRFSIVIKESGLDLKLSVILHIFL